MTLYHPRVLADKLEGLLPELQRWSHRAQMALDNAQVQQKRREDKLLQTSHSVQGQEHQLAQDQKYVQQDEELLLVCAKNCQEILATAQQIASVAQSILNNAQETYNRKRQALQSAREALTRAKQALQHATANVKGKRAEFTNARVSGNEKDESVIHQQLSVAEEVQRQASSSERAASAQVANCETSVALANQALQLAQVAHKQVQAGLKASEDSIEFTRAASRALDVGKQELGKEEVAVNAIVETLRNATQITQEASVQLVGARSHEQPAQLHTSDAVRTLQMKIDLLLFMNRPELEVVSNHMVASVLQLGAVANTEELAYILNARLGRLLRRLDGIDGLKPYRWRSLGLEQRVEALQEAHNVMAAIYSFKCCKVELAPMPPNRFGGFSHITEDIRLNVRLVAGNNRIETLKTLFHESRHAYQWHLAKCFRNSFGWLSNADWTLAQVWSDNTDDYKNPGQYSLQEYRNQPIEADAFGFENIVIDLLYGN
jgi:hypothetical protein